MRRAAAWAAIAVAVITAVLAICYLARPLLATESDATMRELSQADLPCGAVLAVLAEGAAPVGDAAYEFSCVEQAGYRGDVAVGLGVAALAFAALGAVVLVRRLEPPWWAVLGTAVASAAIVGLVLVQPVEDAAFQSTATAASGLSCGRTYTLILTDGVHISYLYNPQTGPRDLRAEARCREILAPLAVTAEVAGTATLAFGAGAAVLLLSRSAPVARIAAESPPRPGRARPSQQTQPRSTPPR